MAWITGLAISPPSPRALLHGVTSDVTPTNSVCVHTRLIDEVEEWKIQKTLEMARTMGATTVVEFFPWAYIEATRGQFDWSQADKIMLHAHNMNIQVIARLGLVPEWARQSEEESHTSNYLTAEYYDDFGDFVVAFVERYGDTVNDIIIWNEPNLAFEWGFQEVDPNTYVRLLQTVYPMVKAAKPEINILAGALAPTLEDAGSQHAMNDIDYLQAMYEAGGKDYFDVLAVHTYGFTSSAEASPASDVLNFRRTELLRQIMETFGDANKPIVITETGWNDHPRAVNSVSPAQRSQYTVDAYTYASDKWPWLDNMCIWVFRYPQTTYSYRDNFALVNAAFVPKPIYFALQAYAFDQNQDDELWLPPPTND